MNIGVIGTGGVGGYFGGKLAKYLEKDDQNNVYFLARGQHLKQIQKKGLTLLIDNKETLICKPTLVTDNVADFPVLDVCIICVKVYDLENVLIKLKDKITEKTCILPLLNGVNIVDRINRVLDNALVYPACAYIGTHIKEPGVIEKSEGKAKIILGPNKLNKNTLSKPSFLNFFDKAGVNYEWTSDNYASIWQKYMCVAPYSIVCAYNGKTFGAVYEDKTLLQEVYNITKLIYDIAKKENISLAEDAIEKAVNLAAGYSYDLKPSFMRDFEKKGQKVEKATFIDTLIELAKKHDLDYSCVQDIIF